MNFKAFYSRPKISGALIKENLRRLWALPVLAFLVYFLSGAFPVLLSYNHIDDISYYIELSLDNQQPFFLAAHLLVPILAAVLLFRFLQAENAVTAMHAMPFTRMKLYVSNLVSGIVLITLPILLNGILLLAISKPAYSAWVLEAVKGGEQAEMINLFARMDILNWMWESLVIVLAVYAISIFAGMVTGNTIVHLAAALGFNFLVPALYIAFIGYCEFFLFGFDRSESYETVLLSLSPFLNVASVGGSFSLLFSVIWIGVAVAVLAVSAALYGKRKLERTGDVFVFSFMAPFVNFLIAFFGMTLLGFYFDSIEEGYRYAGFAAGALIFFLIGRMIVTKTARVFNAKTLRQLILYGAMAAAFLCVLDFDPIGYETNVPGVNEVKSVRLNTFSDSSYDDWQRFEASNFNRQEEGDGMIYKQKETIAAVRELHKSILKSKPMNLLQNNVRRYQITYEKNGSFPLKRAYPVSDTFLRNSPAYKKLYESKEYKDFFALSNLRCEKIKSISVKDPLLNRFPLGIYGPAEIKELMEALDKDFSVRSFEEQNDPKRAYADIVIFYEAPSIEGRAYATTIELIVRHTDENAIAWFKEKGYERQFAVMPEDVRAIEIYRVLEEGTPEAMGETAALDVKATKEAGDEKLLITDPGQIGILLEDYEREPRQEKSFYTGYVLLKELPDMLSGTGRQLYFSFDAAPSFLADGFAAL